MPWDECEKLNAATITTEQAVNEAILASIEIYEAFRMKCPTDWRDLGPRGQVALMDLHRLAIRAARPTCSELLPLIDEVYRRVGAPGDWGYGTPTGDAARWLYDTIRLLSWRAGQRDALTPAEQTLFDSQMKQASLSSCEARSLMP